jgi:two-component system, NarL family, sensor histidine kinase UhpB
LSRSQVRDSRRRPERLSLFTRVFLANAAVLGLITLVLLFSPIEISYPVTENQAVLIVAGFLVSLVLNVLLVRGVVGPLRRLTETMRRVEPLEPGRRVVVPHADADVEALTTAFNEMLDRLETERRESGRRALAAQEQERQRIARELHDEIGQVLTGVMLELEQAGKAGPEANGGRLAEARDAVRQSLDDVRRIARELRPEALDQLGLQSALRSLCNQAAAQSGLRVERRLALERSDLSPEVELVVYRVAQESLTNVLRHAGASHVVVELAEADGVLTLVVRDDGSGVPTGAEGGGITGMRERALLVGGHLTVTTPPGGGTEVRLEVPR